MVLCLAKVTTSNQASFDSVDAETMKYVSLVVIKEPCDHSGL